MNITRDIVIDLLPVYESGEASADTRALVEDFLKQDTEFARIVKAAHKRPQARPEPIQPSPPASGEVAAVTRTRNTLRWRSWTMAAAIFLTMLPFSMAGDSDNGLRFFMWRDVPASRFALVLAAALWWSYFRQSQAIRKAGW
ncbi:MAG: hypothetical protein ACT4QD_08945 [Acidobacteriota bacterium]